MVKRVVLYIFIFITSFYVGFCFLEGPEDKIVPENYIPKNPVEQRVEYKEKAEMPEDGYVNINKASVYELTALPGIGAAMAERIIDFREENGEFEVREDILKVSGIGEKTFEKIKDMIILN